MSRTLSALFDNRADAEAAKDRLKAANVDVSHVHIHDQSSEGYSATDYSSKEDRGFWKRLTSMELPEQDRHTYEEGVRRGGCLLTAEVDADQATEAARILEQDSVDIDQRSDEWRQSGWNYEPTAALAGAGALGGTTAAAYDNAPVGDRAANEERIPLVEEKLAVGKREVDRGGVRVRSYVVETPVQEQVSLRNEQVSIDRRPVDRELGAGEDAFQERTIEMTARGEEAVVGKQARVREEIVVRKDADERTEVVEDTVRHTEVDIDEDRGELAGDRSTDFDRK